jgi:carbonic anhydrase/acetyltransferase-like protein (isoleucine patch superfamily)
MPRENESRRRSRGGLGWCSSLLSCILIAASAEVARAQTLVAGPELQVNSITSSDEFAPKVAIARDGAFVVLWQSAAQHSVEGQRFDADAQPLGGQFRVATGAYAPSIAIDDGGGFVVVWADYSTGFVRRFDREGSPIGSSFQVARDFYVPSVATKPGGGFIVTWSEYYGEILAQSFDAAGASAGDPVTITEVGWTPQVASDGAGNTVVTWTDYVSPNEVRGQRLDSAGNKVGADFTIAGNLGSGGRHALGMADDGSFVVAWQRGDPNVEGTAVFARRFNRRAVAIGPEFQVNGARIGAQSSRLDAAMNRTGDFLVVWSAFRQGSDFDTFGRRFDRTGRAFGPEFRINEHAAGDQDFPAAALDARGNAVVAWQSDGQDGVQNGIFARRFTVSGGGGAAGDVDRDGVTDALDNCPTIANSDQRDDNFDGYGDECVSPDVAIPPSVSLGLNPVIGRGSWLGAGVALGDDATLGEFVRLEAQMSAGRGLLAHDFVTVGRRSRLGDDVTIGFATRTDAGVSIGDRVTIGDQVVIRRNVSIERDAVVEPLVVLYAGCRIGAEATIGMGARIGRAATVRAGAVIPPGTTVPAGATVP